MQINNRREKLLNKKGKSKYTSLIFYIFIYVLLSVVVTIVFGFLYQFLGTINNPFSYSGLFTIGIGEAVPQKNDYRLFVILHGLISLILNGFFVGIIVFELQKKKNDIVVYSKPLMTKVDDQYLLNIGLKNFGETLIDFSFGVELFDNNDNRISIYSGKRHYFRIRERIQIKSKEDKDFIRNLRKMIFDEQVPRLRIFYKGFGVESGSAIAFLTEVKLEEIYFVKSYDVKREYKKKHFQVDKTYKNNLKVVLHDKSTQDRIYKEFIEISHEEKSPTN